MAMLSMSQCGVLRWGKCTMVESIYSQCNLMHCAVSCRQSHDKNREFTICRQHLQNFAAAAVDQKLELSKVVGGACAELRITTHTSIGDTSVLAYLVL